MSTFNVPDMSCGHCKAAVEKAIAGQDPAATVSVDLAARQVSVESALTDAALIAALQDGGYRASVA
ncbi:heavy-metal-associated domain-containing protein [Sulfitobacter sabulilitoris]|uniref:Heavy-metal-associated domain-containing protein n=1 Tax=Sulfitobacter sabulilitoris TaxID=2562655 RepID=A0A5S3PD03_9RHOB|nr:heavy-metal-associated domain-containing protein [Sulfitobacter sabulilitoris]TMM51706.1 heavy-metal-associated domain-containing protein [Sulfitobacter sabulilitoris]